MLWKIYIAHDTGSYINLLQSINNAFIKKKHKDMQMTNYIKMCK